MGYFIVPQESTSQLSFFEMETSDIKPKKEAGSSSAPRETGQDRLAVVLKSSAGRQRYLFRNSAFLLVLLVLLGAFVSSFFEISLTVRKLDPLAYEERVNEILSSTPLIDGHNDLPYLLRIELQNKIYDSSEFQFWNGNFILILSRLQPADILVRIGKSYRLETAARRTCGRTILVGFCRGKTPQ